MAVKNIGAIPFCFSPHKSPNIWRILKRIPITLVTRVTPISTVQA